MESKSPSSIIMPPDTTPSSKLAVRKSGRQSKQSGENVLTGRHMCVFWLGGASYALDVAYVGEIVAGPAIMAVPKTPPGVLGMCNLRGTALAILDLCTVLDLPRGDAGAGTQKQFSVLVLRARQMTAGVKIDKAEAVYRFDRLELKASGVMKEHPAVKGLLELGAGNVVTLLDGEELFSRLVAMRYRKQTHD